MIQLIAVSTAGLLFMVSVIVLILGSERHALIRVASGLVAVIGMVIAALLFLVAVAGGGL